MPPILESQKLKPPRCYLCGSREGLSKLTLQSDPDAAAVARRMGLWVYLCEGCSDERGPCYRSGACDISDIEHVCVEIELAALQKGRLTRAQWRCFGLVDLLDFPELEAKHREWLKKRICGCEKNVKK